MTQGSCLKTFYSIIEANSSIVRVSGRREKLILSVIWSENSQLFNEFLSIFLLWLNEADTILLNLIYLLSSIRGVGFFVKWINAESTFGLGIKTSGGIMNLDFTYIFYCIFI